MTTSEFHAFIIKGEDSESEEELKITTQKNIKTSNLKSFLSWQIVKNYSSLWIKFNNSLYKKISLASNDLRAAENCIMKSGVTLQSIYTNMETIITDSEIILKKLKIIVADSYMPLKKI